MFYLKAAMKIYFKFFIIGIVAALTLIPPSIVFSAIAGISIMTVISVIASIPFILPIVCLVKILISDQYAIWERLRP